MKKVLAALIACVVLLTAARAYAADAGGDAILGQWYTEGDESIVEIYPCDGAYCGRIVWLAEPLTPEGEVKTDRNNPDESRRDTLIIGLEILSGLQYNGRNAWTGGRIYDPNNGNTYSCKGALKKGEFRLRGFIGVSLVGRTTIWRRNETPIVEGE
jgi:uncharacterized protein (DUF2147 family)